MQIMKRARVKGLKGVIHCYSHSRKWQRGVCEDGLLHWSGQSGYVQNGRRLKETVEAIPLSFFLKQTAHTLHRSHTAGKRNHSMYIKYKVCGRGRLQGLRGLMKRSWRRLKRHSGKCIAYKFYKIQNADGSFGHPFLTNGGFKEPAVVS